MEFDTLLADIWEGETVAPSEKKARSSGRNTLKALFEMGKIPGVIIDEKIYIHKSVENPFSKEGKDHDK